MDINALKEAGLTDGEARTYMAMLGLGESTVGPIIEKSKISRSIAYKILDSLMRKGLVSFIIKEKTKHFRADSPERILDYVEKRKNSLEDSRKKIEAMLPSLQRITAGRENEVRVFTGFKGMISVHEHTYQRLQKGEEYFYMGVLPEQPEHYHAYWKRDHVRRAKAGIKCRLLFNSKTDKTILKNRNSYAGCQARYMPMGIETPAWFMAYEGVAVIGLQSDEPITIEILNPNIAESFRNYFESFWKMSQPFGKK